MAAGGKGVAVLADGGCQEETVYYQVAVGGDKEGPDG